MRRVAFALAALGLLVGVLSPPVAAATPTTTFTASVPSTILIYARGAAAYVPETYSCRLNTPGIAFAYANTVITDPLAGGRTAYAATGLGTTVTCDGRFHVINLSLPATLLGPPTYALAPTTHATIEISFPECSADETLCDGGQYLQSRSVTLATSGSSPATATINGAANLLAGGRGAAVKASFRCPAGTHAALFVTVTQRAEGGTIVTSPFVPLPIADLTPLCDGRAHFAWFTTPAQTGSHYRPGIAWAEAHFFPDRKTLLNGTTAARVVDLEPVS
jgi:hypothetical protein